MTTEILGFLIIVGTLAAVLIRRTMQPTDSAVDELELSVEKFRYEMERSADEIIGRLDAHIDQLEKLIRQADERSDRLAEQIEVLRQQLVAVPPERRAEGTKAVEEASAFSRVLDEYVERGNAAEYVPQGEAPLREAAEPIFALEQTAVAPRPQRPRLKNYAADPRYQAPPYPEEGITPIKPVEALPPNAVRPVAAAAASEPEIKIQPATVANRSAASPAKAPVRKRVNPAATVDLSLSARGSTAAPALSPTEEARRLIAAGLSTDLIARRVRLGTGAIELLRQMKSPR